MEVYNACTHYILHSKIRKKGHTCIRRSNEEDLPNLAEFIISKTDGVRSLILTNYSILSQVKPRL